MEPLLGFGLNVELGGIFLWVAAAALTGCAILAVLYYDASKNRSTDELVQGLRAEPAPLADHAGELADVGKLAMELRVLGATALVDPLDDLSRGRVKAAIADLAKLFRRAGNGSGDLAALLADPIVEGRLPAWLQDPVKRERLHGLLRKAKLAEQDDKQKEEALNAQTGNVMGGGRPAVSG